MFLAPFDLKMVKEGKMPGDTFIGICERNHLK
jgi:hypothetical protein